MRRLALVLWAPLALAACSDGTGSTAAGSVQLRFGVAAGPSAAKAPAGGPSAAGLVVTGSNGTLAISGLQVVVARFSLRGAHDQPCLVGRTSQEAGDDSSECEFEAGPLFLDVPLDGSQLTVATGEVPPGSYTRVRFRVKNLDFRDDDDEGDDDSQSQQASATLFTQIRQQYPDWPARASLRVTGSFTPTGGAARPFTAYLRAEARMELPLAPPLEVGEGSAASSVSVLLDPAALFRVGAGVRDLSALGSTLGEMELGGGFHGEGRSGHR
jgi:hypothetical protein